MKPLTSAFSHINLQPNAKTKSGKDWTKPYALEEILKAPPKLVSTYDELVKDIAQLQYHNRQFTLFYRGQKKDYLTTDNKSTILASIFRKNLNDPKLLLKQRFEDLANYVTELRKAFNSKTQKFAGTHLLNKYEEISWAILQHYQVCPTPVIDITHSLHVACSFAYEGNTTGNTGVVYVLGLPGSTDAISYNTYEELVNIRLLSICPPQAQRPFFQEGYLLGNFPNYRMDDPARVKQFDPARRIIAKFEIPISDDFWGADFKRLPTSKIYPQVDEVKNICENLKPKP